MCTCGHTGEAHEHYRAGTDCGSCRCGRYRSARLRKIIFFWRKR
jgi:hypothetical protein